MTTATVSTPHPPHSGGVIIHLGKDAWAGEVPSGPLRFDTEDVTVPFAVPYADEVTQPLAAAPLETGVILRQRYVLRDVIGRGGDSIVYRAQDMHRTLADARSERVIALKALRPERRLDPFALKRFKRSFLQMQRLTNRRIARVFDLDSDNDTWFMTMEVVVGRDMKAWAHEATSLAQRLKVLGACCEALEYAHSMGIVHGDLKPSNVLVTADDDVKLIDFGSARTPNVVSDNTTDLSAAATVAYASPQVLAGSDVEPRDDVFSLACLSYWVLSQGCHPFGGKSSLEARRIRMCPTTIPDLPSRLFEVLALGLSLERERRPPSAQAFLEALMRHELRPCVISGDASTAPATDRITRTDDSPEASIGVGTPKALIPSSVAVGTRAHHRAGSAAAFARIGSLLQATQFAGLAMARRTALRVAENAAAWRSACNTLQMVLVLVIVGMVALSLSGRPPREDSVPVAKLPPVTRPPTSNKPPSPVEAIAPIEAPPPPVVVTGPKPLFHAPGAVEFESGRLYVGAEQSLIAIPVRRLRSTRGRASVAWVIEGGTAQPGVDYKAVDSKVIRFFDGQKVRVLFIQLIKGSTTADRGPRTFTVGLRKVGNGPVLGQVSHVTVTIAPTQILGDSRPKGQYR